MESDIDAVMALCPGAKRNEIEVDLRKTKSVEETINRFLDGNLLEGTHLDPSYAVLSSATDKPLQQFENPPPFSPEPYTTFDEPNYNAKSNTNRSNLDALFYDSTPSPQILQTFSSPIHYPNDLEFDSLPPLPPPSPSPTKTMTNSNKNYYTNETLDAIELKTPTQDSDSISIIELSPSPKKRKTVENYPKNNIHDDDEDDDVIDLSESPVKKSTGIQLSNDDISAPLVLSSDSEFEKLPNLRDDKDDDDDDDDDFAAILLSTNGSPRKKYKVAVALDPEEEIRRYLADYDSSASKSAGDKSKTQTQRKQKDDDDDVDDGEEVPKPQAKRKRKTEEEKENERLEKEQQKEAKRREREEQKRLKELEKEQKRLEKQREKEEKARNKEKAVPANAINKLRTKQETIPNMTIVLSTDYVLLPGGSAIITRMRDAGVGIEIEKLPIPESIIWKRKESRMYDQTKKCWVQAEEHIIEEEWLLIHLDGVTLARICNNEDVFGWYDNGTFNNNPMGQNPLLRHLAKVKAMLPEKRKIIYFIEDLKKYYTLRQNAAKKKFMAQVRAIDADDALGSNKKSQSKKGEVTIDVGTLPPKNVMDRMLLELQLYGRVFIHCSPDAEISVEWIYSMTGDISIAEEAKYRKETLTMLNFGDVIKSGKDLQDSWSRMLQELRLVTETTANAIVQVYPTPRALFNEYKKCGGNVKKAEELLVGIDVNPGMGKREHKIGPVISKKIFECMMGVEEETFIN